MKKLIISLFFTMFSLNSYASISDEGYYGSLRMNMAWQKADNMDLSLRPGIGSFVPDKNKTDFLNGSIAGGFQYGNGWRTEAEYTFDTKTTDYTSGSTAFATSLNHHETKSQRLMFNAYRDYELFKAVSIYGMLGLGVAETKSSGWQGNTSREYNTNTDSNIAYSLGFGVSFEVVSSLSLDLGYRYVDLGKVESGMNAFTNARGLQDEQMKAHLKSQEITLGVRYLF